jgi:uncharacterized membrane protein
VPILRVLPFGVLALMFAFAFATWGSLPPEIPTHFGFDGSVNAVATTSVQVWFGLPFIALGVHLILVTLIHSLPRRPDLFNFPDKDRFLRLPTTYQGPVIAIMQWMLDLTSVLTVLLLATGQVTIWLGATGGNAALGTNVLLGLTVAFVPLIAIPLKRLTHAVDAAERRWRDDELATQRTP